MGTEVGYVTRDLDTTFKIRRSKVNLQGRGHIVAASRTACWSILNVTFTFVVGLRSAPTSFIGHEIPAAVSDGLQQQQLQQQSTGFCPHRAALSVPPAWQGRSVAGPKLRLVNMAAFVEFAVPAATADMFTTNAVRMHAAVE